MRFNCTTDKDGSGLLAKTIEPLSKSSLHMVCCSGLEISIRMHLASGDLVRNRGRNTAPLQRQKHFAKGRNISLDFRSCLLHPSSRTWDSKPQELIPALQKRILSKSATPCDPDLFFVGAFAGSMRHLCKAKLDVSQACI